MHTSYFTGISTKVYMDPFGCTFFFIIEVKQVLKNQEHHMRPHMTKFISLALHSIRVLFVNEHCIGALKAYIRMKRKLYFYFQYLMLMQTWRLPSVLVIFSFNNIQKDYIWLNVTTLQYLYNSSKNFILFSSCSVLLSDAQGLHVMR